MNKLTATAGTLAALNESTGTGDVVLAWENTDGVTTFSSIPRTQLTQIITQHEAQRQTGQEQPTLCLSTVKRVASQLGWTPPGQAGQEVAVWRDALEDAILALENSGWTRNRDASLTTLRQALAAPQPAAQPAAPEGYKLVPLEPTEEMLVAGGDDLDYCLTCGYDNGPGNCGPVYTAMVEAAPL